MAKDEIMDRLLQMLAEMQNKPKRNYELECRVGKIQACTNTFEAGYSHSQVVLIRKLLQALDKCCTHRPDVWTKTPQCITVRGYYKNNIRQECDANRTTQRFVQKKKLCVLDLNVKERDKDLRICLAEEKVMQCKELVSSAPSQVRLIQRASFTEDQRICKYVYDISKVSEPAATKLDCTTKPCRYECEIEMHIVDIHKLSHEQFRACAHGFLQRMKALLGTSYLDPDTDACMKLPHPILTLHKYDAFLKSLY